MQRFQPAVRGLVGGSSCFCHTQKTVVMLLGKIKGPTYSHEKSNLVIPAIKGFSGTGCTYNHLQSRAAKSNKPQERGNLRMAPAVKILPAHLACRCL